MIGRSELIINSDGSVFHLHLRPEQLADTVILVGDPDRVDIVAGYFDACEFRVQNREFVAVTGTLNGTRLTALSTGIGADNIDIVMNELDALANIDFQSRTSTPQKRTLRIVRIGTSGCISDTAGLNDFLITKKAVGLDGLLNFYDGRDCISDADFEQQFIIHTNWPARLATPYVVDCSPELYALFSGTGFADGITATAPGFYAPQGRALRVPLTIPDVNSRLASFVYNGAHITNYEMECAPIYGLAALMGHQAIAVCQIIMDRVRKKADVGYNEKMKQLIQTVLTKLIS
ncbi:MAG: nucleoside phosphorylase [Bacteroidales bacterium]|jgi:uridine phosphorylase|nr:nucleoside phosphorylase [Bacteroidales bacterium]